MIGRIIMDRCLGEQIVKTLALLIAFTISLAGCSPADQPSAGTEEAAATDSADTVYTNGKIYTVNE